MKKILLLCAMAVMSIGAFAQRNIDLEVVEVTSPTEVRNQTPFTVRWLMRNNGPDQIQVGDSIFYRFNIGGNIFPASGFYAAVMTANINSNDTFGFAAQANGLTFNSNATSFVCLFPALVVNRGAANPINFEDTAQDNDNVACIENVNFIASGLSTGDFKISEDKLLVKTYPSPANNVLNFDVSSITVGDAVINIYDLTGKLVKTETITVQGNGLITESKIQVSDLKSGIYVYEVKFEDFTTSGKVVITH